MVGLCRPEARSVMGSWSASRAAAAAAAASSYRGYSSQTGGGGDGGDGGGDGGGTGYRDIIPDRVVGESSQGRDRERRTYLVGEDDEGTAAFAPLSPTPYHLAH